ncbi:unnamed protein product [Ceratitis capitata]|uniref:(Mediterranean fruit fly) hypothetical protein n=1 Tax=Ceratitis capitata TaxID=7213 RepID=A0A811VBG8_CERCA|nr:unnamed protein product [Ceratitis capitata]
MRISLVGAYFCAEKMGPICIVVFEQLLSSWELKFSALQHPSFVCSKNLFSLVLPQQQQRSLTIGHFGTASSEAQNASDWITLN